MCPSFGGTTGGSGHRDGSAKGWLREHRRHCRRPCGPVMIVGWWAGPWGASQSPQPHLEDCSTYYPLRPTRLYCTANSPVQGDLCGVRSTYGRVLRRGYGVDDGGLAGLDLDLLDERVDEGPGLGKLAGLEELAHLGGEGGDGVGAVEELTPFREKRPRLPSGDLQR